MRKWIKGIVFALLLAGGAILCVVRWQAWFGMPAEPQWTGDTISYTFPSLSLEGRDGEGFTILVLGDIHNRLTTADYDTLAARVPQAEMVLQTGDWLDRGQWYYRQLLLREWTNSDLCGLPVIACPGNHEYSKGLKKSLSPVWEQTFAIPSSAVRLRNVPGVSYYTDCSQVRFIVLDTNPLSRLVYLTRTLTWLRQAMNTADGRYTVVLMHHPVFSAAKGRFNPLIYATFRYALGQADLVLAGHDHSYLRRAPFVVLNTAGKPKQQHFLFQPEVSDTVPVYGVITLNSKLSTLNFAVHRLSDGMQIDSLYVTHD